MRVNAGSMGDALAPILKFTFPLTEPLVGKRRAEVPDEAAQQAARKRQKRANARVAQCLGSVRSPQPKEGQEQDLSRAAVDAQCCVGDAQADGSSKGAN